MFLITLLFGNQVTMLDSPIISFLVRLLTVFCEYICFIFLIPTFHNFLFIPKWKKNPQFKISTGSTNSTNVHNYISPHSHYVIFLYLYKTHELYCTPSFFTVLSSLILFSSFFLHDSMSFWDSHTVLTPHKSSVPLMVHPLYSHTLYLSLPSRDKTQNLISQWLGCGFYQSLYLYIPITSFLLISLKNSIYIEILHLSITVIALQIWK